jgi:hypothetical protein
MSYKGPAIKVVQFYALTFYDSLTIAFESLEAISLDDLGTVVKTKSYDNVDLIPNIVTINTIEQTITLVGSKINDTTYIIQKNGLGDKFVLSYDFSRDTVITGIEYLYHMYKNLI